MKSFADSSQLATLICVFTLDRIGRRWTLYWGAAGQAICCFCAGGLAYAVAQSNNETYKKHVGAGAVFFVYLYTAIFGATWLTVPWLYPAEVCATSIAFDIMSILTEADFPTSDPR